MSWYHGRSRALAILITGCLITFQAQSVAQQRPAATPVIVVFDDAVAFDSFRPNYRADDRAAANPRAWDYVDPGVAGLVQAMEAREGFRADHVYSHALRGFSARLTAGQIAALRSDTNVSYIEVDGTMTAIAQTLPWASTRLTRI
jgi:hypothetical protein